MLRHSKQVGNVVLKTLRIVPRRQSAIDGTSLRSRAGWRGCALRLVLTSGRIHRIAAVRAWFITSIRAVARCG